MIKLNQLLKEETFTATNKETGKTSVFKTKDSRDAAIKAGTHDAIKDKEQPSAPKAAGSDMFGGDYAKDRGGEAPKGDTNLAPKVDMGVDSVVYNKRTKTVGIVRMADERGETKTDADGNVNTDELEPYNPMKYPHQKDAQVAPSTSKEIDSRGLWKPFSQSNQPTQSELKTKDGKDLKTAIGDNIKERSKNNDFEKSGPYTILVRTGQYNDKIVANSKRIDNIDDLTKSYHTMRNKYDRKGTTFIEDGWGRTVFSESVVKQSSTKLTKLMENDPCWKGYKQVGMKDKNGREVPNCVPESVVKEAGIPKLFLKIEAVKKKIKELMDARKAAVIPYNKETDPKKKEALKQPLIKLTNQIQAYEKNLLNLLDMEEKYIQTLNQNDELELA
jgi:hypothetical protein